MEANDAGASRLVQLAPELLREILGRASGHDRCALAGTCRTLRQLVVASTTAVSLSCLQARWLANALDKWPTLRQVKSIRLEARGPWGQDHGIAALQLSERLCTRCSQLEAFKAPADSRPAEVLISGLGAYAGGWVLRNLTTLSLVNPGHPTGSVMLQHLTELVGLFVEPLEPPLFEGELLTYTADLLYEGSLPNLRRILLYAFIERGEEILPALQGHWADLAPIGGTLEAVALLDSAAFFPPEDGEAPDSQIQGVRFPALRELHLTTSHAAFYPRDWGATFPAVQSLVVGDACYFLPRLPDLARVAALPRLASLSLVGAAGRGAFMGGSLAGLAGCARLRELSLFRVARLQEAGADDEAAAAAAAPVAAAAAAAAAAGPVAAPAEGFAPPQAVEPAAGLGGFDGGEGGNGVDDGGGLHDDGGNGLESAPIPISELAAAARAPALQLLTLTGCPLVSGFDCAPEADVASAYAAAIEAAAARPLAVSVRLSALDAPQPTLLPAQYQWPAPLGAL
ncbi:hypothetical protein Rsub_02442 [Raphidocelis subcapitata]|uniref:Uncharacterized protein n=1 Tax=Raphidocelis subcapitata TaxID=307507 RepID=A0A2V0NRS8_9CHLO|nr:hypothetical protein Rsub_02442 [Raphidocelis subcapitata]|eukprot:GBF90336.1 hypothetical protein Rsub_02442 [Raphidocelis subcapitata]